MDPWFVRRLPDQLPCFRAYVHELAGETRPGNEMKNDKSFRFQNLQ